MSQAGAGPPLCWTPDLSDDGRRREVRDAGTKPPEFCRRAVELARLREPPIAQIAKGLGSPSRACGTGWPGPVSTRASAKAWLPDHWLAQRIRASGVRAAARKLGERRAPGGPGPPPGRPSRRFAGGLLFPAPPPHPPPQPPLP